MHVQHVREIAKQSDAALAAYLGLSTDAEHSGTIRSLTAEFPRAPLDRKVAIAAYLARHGSAITFDSRFVQYCQSDRYDRQVHATNVELHLLQALARDGAPDASGLPLTSEITDFHAALSAQSPLILDRVREVLGGVKNKSFVHIGANDLRGADDEGQSWIIRAPDWACFLVEPQPLVFERLRENIGDAPNVTLINAAIADHDGTAELTVYRRDRWSSMAARTLRMRERFNEPSRVVQVPCLTVETLLRSNGIGEPGFLLIDTEGLDKVILDQFLDRCRPAVIICEIAHVAPTNQSAVLRRLGENGYLYRLMNGVRDVLAIRSDVAEDHDIST